VHVFLGELSLTFTLFSSGCLFGDEIKFHCLENENLFGTPLGDVYIASWAVFYTMFCPAINWLKQKHFIYGLQASTGPRGRNLNFTFCTLSRKSKARISCLNEKYKSGGLV
jgi:hypothetical protein